MAENPNANPYTTPPVQGPGEQAPPVQQQGQPDYSVPPTYNRPPEKTGLARMIPTENPKALIAYYVGIFSFFPGLCVVLGPVAFIYGILGLRAYQANPAISGRVHSWIGIIVGGISGILGIAFFVWLYGSVGVGQP
jgi:hypothetical protein